MAKPYSLDLRERIVRAVEAGSSRRGAAEQFAVSESCAIKLVQRWRRTGSVEPGHGRKKPFALAGHEACVRTLLAAQPDATLEELKVLWRTAPHSSIACPEKKGGLTTSWDLRWLAVADVSWKQ